MHAKDINWQFINSRACNYKALYNYGFALNTLYIIIGEQGWRSGESARLPPMCPGFDSRTRRHMWAEFVGSLLRRGSSIRYINPLCEVYRRHKVEWIDQAENLCQMYVDISYILVVFSYIDGFLGFG